jgi:hypothetical protein
MAIQTPQGATRWKITSGVVQHLERPGWRGWSGCQRRFGRGDILSVSHDFLNWCWTGHGFSGFGRSLLRNGAE